jgi:acyl carrier protein
MEASRDAPLAPDRMCAPTDIVGARALVRQLLRTIAPDVDVATIDQYETMHDVADLDSLDFMSLMSAAAAATGMPIPPRDYPLVVSLEGFAQYLLTRRVDAG